MYISQDLSVKIYKSIVQMNEFEDKFNTAKMKTFNFLKNSECLKKC